MPDKSTKIIVCDRDSSASFSETVLFTTADQFRKDMNAVIARSGFRRCFCEVEATDWEPTADEMAQMDAIAEGE